jgi:hypothetical protein
MRAVNNKIIVRADVDQKNTFIVGDVEVMAAALFEKNYREKSPVICQVEQGNEIVTKDEILICHHNTFYLPSPYHLFDDRYSIPCNGNIVFCKLNVSGGYLIPIYGNFFCTKVDIETVIPLPPSQRSQYNDRVVVTDSGYTNFKEGQLLFTRPFAAYEIVYNWEGQRRRIFKCPDFAVSGMFIPE